MLSKIVLIFLIFITPTGINCSATPLIEFLLMLLANHDENIIEIDRDNKPYTLDFRFIDGEMAAIKWAQFSPKNDQANACYKHFSRLIRTYYDSKIIGKTKEKYGYWIDLNHFSFLTNTPDTENNDRKILLERHFSAQNFHSPIFPLEDTHVDDDPLMQSIPLKDLLFSSDLPAQDAGTPD